MGRSWSHVTKKRCHWGAEPQPLSRRMERAQARRITPYTLDPADGVGSFQQLPQVFRDFLRAGDHVLEDGLLFGSNGPVGAAEEEFVLHDHDRQAVEDLLRRTGL